MPEYLDPPDDDYAWGFRDGIANNPLPEFFPPPEYFEGRAAAEWDKLQKAIADKKAAA